MIPLRIERTPWFTPLAWLLAAANIGAFAWLVTAPAPTAAHVVARWAFDPAAFLGQAWSPRQVATLFTSAFIHASWVHLLGNVLYLLVFGPLVESKVGSRAFLVLYVACAAIAAMSQALLGGTTAPMVGASGAIAGVLGASVVLAPRARVTALVPVVVVFFMTSLPSIVLVGVWFLLQAANALGVLVPGTGHNVAWFAHVGGFLGGMALTAPLVIARGWRGRKGPRTRSGAKRPRL